VRRKPKIWHDRRAGSAYWQEPVLCWQPARPPAQRLLQCHYIQGSAYKRQMSHTQAMEKPCKMPEWTSRPSGWQSCFVFWRYRVQISAHIQAVLTVLSSNVTLHSHKLIGASFCIHLKGLDVWNFRMFEATGLKIMAPRSLSMAWPSCWISLKSTSWFKSY
jgi:hypothetical protein